jgi:poly(3-hydroxybutyrate) depolymerase
MILATIFSCWAIFGAAVAQQQTAALPALGVTLDQTTVSGLDSGGFMAAQLATAYSSRIKGVGIIAAGPFYCAGTYANLGMLENAVSTCMTPVARAAGASGEISFRNARKFAAEGRIDPVENLQRQRVYAFSGARDLTVKTMVVDEVPQFYRLAGVPADGMQYVRNVEAGHGISSDNPDDLPCAATGAPYINNCGFVQAHELLRHLYPERTQAASKGAPGGQLIRFDQREFLHGNRTSMDDQAYVYVPSACREGGCAVHIAFHGCRQGASQIGSRFYRDAGYNSFADANRLVVLYPQVHRSVAMPLNPQGCWDFWGYSNGGQPGWNFVTRQAPQMEAVMAMLARLGGK